MINRLNNRSECILIIVGYSSLFYLKKLYTKNINDNTKSMDRK